MQSGLYLQKELPWVFVLLGQILECCQKTVHGIINKNWLEAYLHTIMAPILLNCKMHILLFQKCEHLTKYDHTYPAIYTECASPVSQWCLNSVPRRLNKYKLREVILNLLKVRVIIGRRKFLRQQQDSLTIEQGWKFQAIRFLLPAVWWPRAVVLKVWSLKQQYQHHLGIIRNANPHTLHQNYHKANNLCFNKPSR